ncbi:MAG: hypothetical protein GF331_08625, partial [Chitinivibrionales bacterium]|nr:hypothetical protein [Chitinivibrionales bacterium]
MKKYIRFIRGLHSFFNSRLEPEQALEEARTLIAQRIARRGENFLNLVRKGIFEYQRSPYLRLLAASGITFRDIKKWTENDGIEATLTRLRNEEVYITVDEFKGKCPVRRGTEEFMCREGDFDNPFLSAAYEVRSGATRSAGTRIRIDFDYLVQRSLYDAFLLDTHACLTAPIANWFPIF